MTPDAPHDATLQKELAVPRAENQSLEEENEQLKQHNAVLRLKVDAMARKLFGKSSERLDPAQLQMVFDALKKEPDESAKKDPASGSAACDSEAEAAAAPAGNGKRRKRSLEEIIAGLPVDEVFIDPPEVKAEPEAWTCMGAEVTKLVGYIPGKFACQHLVLQERSIAAPGLLGCLAMHVAGWGRRYRPS